MGFLNGGDSGKSKGPSFYLEVTDVPKLIRPMVAAPQSIWGHSIPEVKTVGPDGKPVSIRRYSFEICTSTSRSGQGCQCCSTQDPLWHLLDAKTKVNKKGQRTDFPKKPVHLLPVLEIASGEVKALKGGNGTYKEMDAWYEIQPEGSKNLGRCEWGIYKTGQGMLTNYHVVRSDATPFTAAPEQLAAAKEVIAAAIKDMSPAAPEKFMQTISGDGYAPMSNAASTTSVTVQTTGFITPMSQPVTVNGGVSFSPPPAAPAPVASAPTSNVAPTGNADVLTSFTAWLNEQPEFQGVGILQNLVPVLKQQIGDVNYHKCTPDQIATLRTALTGQLEALRAKKA